MMKKIKSLPTQKRKIVLAFLIVFCIISMACGLKVTIHQLGSEALSEGNYATIIYGQFVKSCDYQFVSIDGEMVQADEYYGSDHYRIKPGRHTLVFKKRDPQSYYPPLWTKKEKLAYDKRHETYRLYKEEVTFEAVPGGKYLIIEKQICVSEKKGAEKSLNFFTIYQTKIKEVDSVKIVSNPNDGEFQPLTGKITKKGPWWGSHDLQLLHLYDGMELPDDKIASLSLDDELINIKDISGMSADGTKISFKQIHATAVFDVVVPYQVFLLVPGKYSITVSYGMCCTGKWSVEDAYITLDAIAGNSYVIEAKSTWLKELKGWIIQYNIKNITGQESGK